MRKKIRHPHPQPYEYSSWRGMKERCQNKNHVSYHLYGGRGITFCERWRKFDNFLTDMGPKPTAKHTLERVNNSGPYCKENCRWATPKEQCLNTRRAIFLTVNGETKSLREWSEIAGLRYQTLHSRMQRGECPERIVSSSDLQRRKYVVKCRGEQKGQARLTDQKVRELRDRHAKGESLRNLAAAFNVGMTTVLKAARRETWTHVE